MRAMGKLRNSFSMAANFTCNSDARARSSSPKTCVKPGLHFCVYFLKLKWKIRLKFKIKIELKFKVRCG